MPPVADAFAPTRHYGLDWLRIGAFVLLILYHIGLVFAPWDWVINTPHRHAGLIAPLAAITPWRLALLFAVSGFASHHLFTRAGSARAFLRARNLRLLLPLGFGMAMLVPLEMWVRVADQGYPHGVLHFWAFDYWRWGAFYGQQFPSWEHLWFIAYLWAYTAVLALVLWSAPVASAQFVKGCAAWLAQGRRILWVPALGLMLAKLALLFVVPETQGLFTDWAGHAQYFPMFLAGFVIAAAPGLWPAIARTWRSALLIAAAAGAVVVMVELSFPGDGVPPHALMAADRMSRMAMGWAMTLALFHLADRWLNRDHRWRRPLAEAVFPAYLVHHPAIVLIAWASLPLALDGWTAFALITAGTAITCAAAYLIGRELDWLRPLIGLAARRRPAGASRSAHLA